MPGCDCFKEQAVLCNKEARREGQRAHEARQGDVTIPQDLAATVGIQRYAFPWLLSTIYEIHMSESIKIV